jgi:hypothetical protein
MTDPLDYRDPIQDLPQRRTAAGWTALGIFCGIGAVFISGCTFVMANIHYTPIAPAPSFMTNTFEWRGPSVVAGLILASLALGVLWGHRRRNSGFVVGVLIGAGVMMLIDGVCFFREW